MLGLATKRVQFCSRVGRNKTPSMAMGSLPWVREGAPLESYDATPCFALRSSRVVLPGPAGGFEVAAATVVVRGGAIVAVHRGDEALPADCVVRDCGDLAVLPGLVDAGARFGECGGLRAGSDSDCYEGFAAGIRESVRERSRVAFECS